MNFAGDDQFFVGRNNQNLYSGIGRADDGLGTADGLFVGFRIDANTEILQIGADSGPGEALFSPMPAKAMASAPPF